MLPRNTTCVSIYNNLTCTPRATQHFTYDHRDRLTHAWTTDDPAAYDETDSYDATGNLQTKGGKLYAYLGSGHAHAPATVANQPFTYDANGNTLTDAGQGRAYTWDARNHLTAVTTTPSAVTPPTSGTPNLFPTPRSGTGSGSPVLTEPSRSGTGSGAPVLTEPGRGNPQGGTPVTQGNRI